MLKLLLPINAKGLAVTPGRRIHIIQSFVTKHKPEFHHELGGLGYQEMFNIVTSC